MLHVAAHALSLLCRHFMPMLQYADAKVVYLTAESDTVLYINIHI